GVWTLLVTYLGSGAAVGADPDAATLPPGIPFASGAGAGWTFAQSGQVVTATHVDSIGAADSASFTLTVGVGAAAVPGVINSAVIAAAGDLDASNDRDSDPTNVQGVPDLTLDKRHTARFEVG